MAFADHFSSIATNYAEFRPTYPDELFVWLADKAPERKQAWDCGCGNGQASMGLAKFFAHVIAMDASAAQIAVAPKHAQIEYRIAMAEGSGIESHTADIVAVGQAVHWFNLDQFYAEARRVLKPQGILAVWAYGWVHISDSDALTERIDSFCQNIVGPYWPKEIEYPARQYQTLPFPFKEIPAPAFNMTGKWTLPQLLGHLRSWSATARYVKENGHDPVKEFEKELRDFWPSPEQPRPVNWPFFMRVGKV